MEVSETEGRKHDLDSDSSVSPMVRESAKLWSRPIEDGSGFEQEFAEYNHYILRKVLFIAVCLILAFVSVGYSLTVGAFDIGFFETYGIIWDHITGNVTNVLYDHVIMQLRMPAIATAFITGAGLAVCGVAMQSILKNPLADPYTTGVSSGAGFGATIAIVYGATFVSGDYSLVLNAFIFALIPTAIIAMVSKLKNASPTVMIMSGIAVMYIFNACTTVMKLWATDESLGAIFRWQVGSVSATTWEQIPIMLVFVLIGIILLQFVSSKINLLSTGDENAKAMGLNVEKFRILCLILVALVSAAVVSFTGLIGFVGLVAPHIVRLFIGPDNKYLLPASAAFGAALLVAAYTVGISIIEPTVLQVGVITAFMGGPLFLWLIIRKDSTIWG